MRRLLPLLSLALVASAFGQSVEAKPSGEPAPKVSAREKWGLTMEQYMLIDPSRRPSGEAFKYWKARKRGPYGNLLERIPGGPRRPVKF